MEASSLACPQCRIAVPVRKRLLLILSEGDKYEYVCPQCGTTCGSTVGKKFAAAPSGVNRFIRTARGKSSKINLGPVPRSARFRLSRAPRQAAGMDTYP